MVMFSVCYLDFGEYILLFALLNLIFFSKIGKSSPFILFNGAANSLRIAGNEKIYLSQLEVIKEKFYQTKLASAFLEGLNFLENAAFTFYALRAESSKCMFSHNLTSNSIFPAEKHSKRFAKDAGAAYIYFSCN